MNPHTGLAHSAAAPPVELLKDKGPSKLHSVPLSLSPICVLIRSCHLLFGLLYSLALAPLVPSGLLFLQLPVTSLSMCAFCFMAMPCGKWDLTSWNRDQTCASALEAWSLNHWLARKSPR